MTISRQYSLPYCTLILEGLNDSTPGVGLQLESRPLMTILVNAECHLAGGALPLSGGREFLESLVKSVSSYAQQFLSKVYHPQLGGEKEPIVRLQHIKDKNLHRLTLLSGTESSNGNGGGKPAALPGNTSAENVQIDLTTVQLFDLVEAVDQFLADSGTLPDIKVSLQPISKRYIKAEKPVAERVIPASAGLASLALAAIAFFVIPIPEVREPLPEPRTKANEETLEEPQDSENAVIEPVTTETPDQITSSETEETEETGEPLSGEELEELLSSAPEIDDPTEVRYLQSNLQKEIYQTWQNREPLGENLEYQVSVGRDGKIIGYRAINDPARERSQETPLPDLLYLKPTDNVASQEPIAQFQVVFSQAGALQISPWHGYKGQPNLGPEIKESAVLRNLNEQLQEKLQEETQAAATYPVELIYRVGITNDGVIANYEPTNTPAWDYLEETPLEKLVKPEAAGIGVEGAGLVPQEPLAQFRVVFKPDGVIEVSPYRGLR